MDCAEEVGVLKGEIGPLVGGERNLTFDILNGRMTVTAGASDPSVEALLPRINSTGMRGEVWQEGAMPRQERRWWHATPA
jgi:Cd2+/Zn2+-exporting ATPase